MANEPTTVPTSKSNAQVATQEVVFSAPAVNPAHDAQARFVEQQWIDAKKLGLGKTHPLAINRDASNITSDPYA